MLVRCATKEDLDKVTLIHLIAFKGFFLTSLGRNFLNEMYLSFLIRDSGILRVICDESNEIVGFSAGTLQPEQFFASLRKNRWLIFFIKAIPGLLKSPKVVFKKLYYALFYKGDSTSELTCSALLSSIGVLPEVRGKAVGKQLLIDFENTVKSDGTVKSIYLTTDKFENDNVVSFYHAANFIVESEFTQPGNRVMLRFIKNIEE
jgi:ribosomal protein S18 acetylase RimI-like enzyme